MTSAESAANRGCGTGQRSWPVPAAEFAINTDMSYFDSSEQHREFDYWTHERVLAYLESQGGVASFWVEDGIYGQLGPDGPSGCADDDDDRATAVIAYLKKVGVHQISRISKKSLKLNATLAARKDSQPFDFPQNESDRFFRVLQRDLGFVHRMPTRI